MRSRIRHSAALLTAITLACVLSPLAVAAGPSAALESKPLGPSVRAADTGVAPSATTHSTPSSLGSTALRTGGSLAAVLVVIAGLGLGVRHLSRKGLLPASISTGAKAPSGLLEVLARYPVGAGQTLLVIKFDRRILLVCQSGGKGITRSGGTMIPVSEVSAPEDVASILLKVRGEEQAAMAEKFQRMLAGEEDTAERALSSRETPALPAPRTHDRTTRPQQPRPRTPVPAAPPARATRALPPQPAPASAIRERLAQMRTQEPAAAVRPVAPTRPQTARPATSRTEFLA